MAVCKLTSADRKGRTYNYMAAVVGSANYYVVNEHGKTCARNELERITFSRRKKKTAENHCTLIIVIYFIFNRFFAIAHIRVSTLLTHRN